MLRALPPIAHFLPPIDGIMDVFDAALACSFGAEVHAPFQSMARSQDLVQPSQDDAALETISDGDACDAVTIDSQSTDCADAPMHAKTPSPSSSLRKRPLSKSAKKDQTPSRVVNADKKCQIKPLRVCDVKEVRCVFIKHLIHGPLPIPLWGVYNVVWDVRDKLQDVSFIRVGTMEHWLQRLISALTRKPARALAKAFVDSFQLTFKDRLNNARLFSDEADDVFSNESPGGVENTCFLARVKKTKLAGIVKLSIGGHSVHCLNHATQALLKLDAGTIEFIASWVAPLVKELAERLGTDGSQPSHALNGGSSEVSSLATKFKFASPPTPNVRDKISWDPKRHAWHVFVRKPKGTFDASDFKVNPDLRGNEYDAEKLAVYRRAVETWNRLDGTTRLRVRTSVV